jgi:hypothetical protein
MGSAEAFSMPLGTHLMSTGSLIHQYVKTGYLSTKKKIFLDDKLGKGGFQCFRLYACIIRD